MNMTKRHIYTISKAGESFIGYLFTDNVLFWETRGYTVTRSNS